MSQVGRYRKKKPKFLTVALELSTNADGVATSIVGNENPVHSRENTIVPRPLFPYGIYAVDPTPRARELIHFIHVEAEYLYRPFRREWFSMAVIDTSAYFISLANASLYMNRMICPGGLEYSDCLESSSYYSTCLNTLSKRLSSRTERSSEGVITTILGFLCHDSNVSNWQRWALHMKGLQEVMQIRGSLQGLSSWVTGFIFWMDIVGSAVSDTKPRFSIPADLTPVSSRQNVASPYLQSLMLRLRTHNSPALNDTALSLEGASHVADIVNHQAKSPTFWNDGMNGTRLIGPLSHQLLSLPRLTESTFESATALDEALREMTRLALLVVLARLKLDFTYIADELGPLQDRFARIFAHDINHDVRFPDLQLWALSIFGSVATQGSSRDLYTVRVCEVANRMEINCGASAFRTIRQIFLIDDMMATDVRALLLESICSDRDCCPKNHCSRSIQRSSQRSDALLI
ncbi:uncharacterized protein A1O9_11625 [Exophiala aquamarina CBS 119918]|uniref:Transcription factor domain-containing protein n=1 Tax=Exophiala aquamarina CBS 119918 TaxID=1182545 RepID=A0A072NX02_9EURO|nr:uncharacterized protein A1O9_11625 [Exophiala aquamarina CBS 119918]KEF52384.1 hypothetical protein A1O9_11625 [Exophiala aquamarina CBS 119918]